ncbi:MAG: tetratricopeptide repeat protein [Candidatus Kariarchaeaceae archaeon]
MKYKTQTISLYYLIRDNGYNRIVDIIDTIEGEEYYFTEILKARIHAQIGKLELAQWIIDSLLPEIFDKNKSREIFCALVTQTYIYWRSGDFSNFKLYLEESKKSYDAIHNKNAFCVQWAVSLMYNLIGNFYWDYGNNDDLVLENYLKSYRIRADLGNKEDLAASMNNIGIAYFRKGDLDRSLKFYENSLQLNDEIQNPASSAAVLLNIGEIHFKRGKLAQALHFLRMSLRELEKTEDLQNIAIRHHYIGQVLAIKGEVRTALKHLQHSIQVFERSENRLQYVTSLIRLSQIEIELGRRSDAKVHLLVALDVFEQWNNDIQLSDIFLMLISICVDEDNNKLAMKYCNRLKILSEQSENELVKLRYALARSKHEKSLKRFRNKVTAQVLLKELIVEDKIDYSIILEAKVQYCDLIIDEYRVFPTPELEKQCNGIISEIYAFGQDEDSYLFMVQAMLLIAKFERIKGNIEKAYDLLGIAAFFAEENELRRIELLIQHEEKLINEMFKISKDISHKINREAMSRKNTLEYLHEVSDFIRKYSD